MEQKQFKIFVAIFLFVFIGFQIILLSSSNITAKLGSVSTILGGTSGIQGTQSAYGLEYGTSGYNKLLEYYQTIELDSMTQQQKERFIRIGTQDKTGCGPCCGLGNGPAIDSSGEIRCGCGHNLALVGLMKYLVTQHGDGFTDAQIFDEIVKWKKVFWPGQIDDTGKIIGS